MSKLLFLGLQEKASSLMARVQNNRISKGKYKKVMEEDELYRPEQDVNSEHDFSSSTEELSNDEETLSNQGTKSPPRKICKVKNAIPKAMALAMAFKKKQQRFQGLSSTRGRATRQLLIEQKKKTSETPEEETRNSNEQGELSRNKTNKQDDDDGKARRGPTMCYKVHGRNEEERLQIILNENFQPIGPDNETVNEFTSFLGTIARKANILPLTIESWPKIGKDKKEELWEYVTKKERKTTKDPTPTQVFIETRKEKRTKRKPGDPRDKLITELKQQDSQATTTVNDVESVVSTIFSSSDKKKRQLRLYGRGVTCTQLKHMAILEETKKKHDEEVQAIRKSYEDKRNQDRAELANGLRSFFSQMEEKSPHMSFDLSMFGSLLVDGQSQKDTQSFPSTSGMLRLHSSASTDVPNNQCVNAMEEEDDEDEDEDLT
ncbi:uncharacterized protein LOC104899254 isoform X6 [Beta vulgaris subsp. vulgaris]|uniref:uncharacterized protein LOC104899254 isoform X6 n=1 Tax=Beta vulgaris subsp. vulgaris TaxID=3555 RepID=UPI0025487DAE|nr:uncharacterized protein LOC104899254 isoform X6 [Beta vulgaris subsp. vulgaris]